jgi:poly-gamma-glutamate synthesis protein (capsule biosynthesis protein)
MVVATSVAPEVVSVFRTLFEGKFPIRRMELVDAFEGDDGRSMAADNTSAFNCRSVTGNPGVWSEHSYGTAIDLNPLENPYVVGGHVEPPAGTRFTDRSLQSPGMIHGGDVVDRAFAAIGWSWGGRWSSPRDYQHFSRSGR